MVAIKCISKKKLSKTSVERLLTEIKLMKDELQHPYIVQMIDFMVSMYVMSPSHDIHMILESGMNTRCTL